MADLSSFTHKFRANGDGSQQNGTPRVAKRNRQPVSCQSCRTRKLKCDRKCPCETCIKRGDAESCSFGGSTRTTPSKNSTGQKSKAQDRLRHLEDLVMQMINTPESDASASASQGLPSLTPLSAYPNPAESGLTARTDGHLQVQGNETRYVGSTHWSTILDNIQELKSVIVSEDIANDTAQPSEMADPDTLFGASRPRSLEHVLEAVPPRVQVDRLMSVYFNAKYAIVPVLHTYQFQRQYEQFWINPLETSPLWISIMFSIMGMANILQGSRSTPNTPNTPNVADGSHKDPYLTAAAQCLILGGFTRPRRFVVEALLLFSQLKYTATLDPSREVGLIFSMIIRMAFRQGYHRDPSYLPHVSPFEGEMRRRTWSMCKVFDLMIAFQLGLPANIPIESWDTGPARNLLDSDFDEDIIDLPQSRAETEATPMLYFVVKSRLMDIFGKVCAHALSMKPQPLSSIQALDVELKEAYKSIPPPIKHRPMSQSFADPASTIMFRINTEFLYQKSICVLHRKYMAQGSVASRTACVNAAMAIMSHLGDIYKEFQPGGQMEADSWMLSSFTMNDFVLASMILCLALTLKTKEGTTVNNDPESRAYLDMLKQSYFICLELGNVSKESKRVSQALGAMLSKLDLEFVPTMTGASQIALNYDMPPNDAPQPVDGDPFANMLDGPENINWEFLDQYLLETEPEYVNQDWVSTPVPGFLGRAMGVIAPVS